PDVKLRDDKDRDAGEDIPASVLSPHKLFDELESEEEYRRFVPAVREAIVHDPVMLGIFDGAEDRDPESVDAQAERLGVTPKEIIRARERLKYAIRVVAEAFKTARETS